MKKLSKHKLLFVAVLPIIAMFSLLAAGAGLYSFLISFLAVSVGEVVFASSEK